MMRSSFLVVWVAMAVLLNGCPPEDGGDSLSIRPRTLELEVGARATLTATSSAAGDRLSWSSNNIAVATVSGAGLVAAVAEGSARIAVASAETGLRDSVVVTVVENPPPSLTIGEPSSDDTRQGPVSFLVSYDGAAEITLAPADITLHTTGTAAATLGEITETAPDQRSVNIDTLAGDGTVSISIAAGTATDAEGNAAPAAGPSAAVNVDNTAPALAIGAPQPGRTSAGPLDYLVTYDGADEITLSAADVLVNGTGTVAATLAEVAATGETERTVSFSSIEGDGTLGISIADGTASDRAGNLAAAAGPSVEAVVDNTPPVATIGPPSRTTTNSGPVTFRVTYEGASEITLSEADVVINGDGAVAAVLDAIESTGENERTIRFSTIAGDGTLGISLNAGTAADDVGNLAPAAGPSATVTIDNTPPTVSIGAPSVASTSAGPVVYRVTYGGAEDVSLTTGDVTLNTTGTARAHIARITDAGEGRHDVTLENVIGNGTLGISLAAGTATDDAGNAAPAAGPSATVEVENEGPTLIIGPPSTQNTFEEPVTYTITYADASEITLAPADVTLSSTDGVTATVAVTGAGATERTVTLSGFTGLGEATIAIAAGSARNEANEPTPAAGPSEPFRVNPLLEPGSGFTGPTPQPDPIGDPGAPGIDAKAIARWDVVPYQTFDGYFEVGVVAFHINDIDRVEFSVEGGPWTAVREMTLNPLTNVVEYWVGLDARDFEDGPIEVRAVAYPKVGVPRVLGGEIDTTHTYDNTNIESERQLWLTGEFAMLLVANAHGAFDPNAIFVSPDGSDSSGDGSVEEPYFTVEFAAHQLRERNQLNNGHVYLMAGIYEAIGLHVLGTDQQTWVTISAAPGLSKGQVVVRSFNTNADAELLRFHGITFLSPAGAEFTWFPGGLGTYSRNLWLDDCDIIGEVRTNNIRLAQDIQSVFLTDINFERNKGGIGGLLLRNVQVQHIGGDTFSGSRLVVNCSVKDVDIVASGNPEAHPDIYQIYDPDLLLENIILYELTAIDKIGSQGFFGGPARDFALVNVAITQLPGNYHCFTVTAASNLLVKGCTFVGATSFMDAHGQPLFRNVVLEESQFGSFPPFVPDLSDQPGIIIRRSEL